MANRQGEGEDAARAVLLLLLTAARAGGDLADGRASHARRDERGAGRRPAVPDMGSATHEQLPLE